MAKTPRLPFNLQHLQFLIVIHEEGSLTAAATKLGIAQPALSVSISKMESEIGVQLLIREPRGVTLTMAGQTLLKYAYDLVSLGKQAADEVSGLTQQPHGEVVIGLPSSAAAVVAIPFIERISERYPMVKLRVVEAFSGYLWKWLETGEIDMCIVFNRNDTSSIHCSLFASEEMYLMSRKTGRSPSSPVSARELGRYPLALPSTTNGFRETVEAHVQKYGGTLNVQLEIDAGHQLVKLVQSGRFHSILAPCSVADEMQQGLIAGRPISPSLVRTISIAKAKMLKKTSPVNLIAGELLEECKALITAEIWKARLI